MTRHCRLPKPWAPAPGEADALRARIVARCDEVGDCLIYRTSSKHPNVHTQSGSCQVRRAAFVLLHGRPLRDGWCVVPKCGDPHCLQHLKEQRVEVTRALAGKVKTPTLGAAVARTKRKASRWTDAQIDEIRCSDEPAAAVAARLGMTTTYVRDIRRGARRRTLTASPWAGMGAAEKRLDRRAE